MIRKESALNKILHPSFFVVGAQKAGTTALHHHLSRHPEVFLPSIKETHFFDDGHGEYDLDIDHYLEKYFSTDTIHMIAGEVDPEYLFFSEVAPRLAEHFPEAKLIFVFRDPVERAYSHYQMSLGRGYERLGFIQAIEKEEMRMGYFPESVNSDEERVLYQPSIDIETKRRQIFNHTAQSNFSYVGRGFYFRQVSRYLEFFPKDRMLFLLSDDLKSEAEQTLKKVYAFLGVGDIPYVPLPDEQTNQATLPKNESLQKFLLDDSPLKGWLKRLMPFGMRLVLRKRLQDFNVEPARLPAMDTEVRAHLRSFYREDVEQLGKLIGRDLSAWLPKASIGNDLG